MSSGKTLTVNGTSISEVLNYYTVSFNSNGGGSVADQVIAENQKAAAPTGVTKTGWTFDGWYETNNFSGAAWSFSDKTVTKKNTLYAKWAVGESYQISYHLNGGSGPNPENPTSYNVESAAFTLKNPTKEGYTFTGWSGSGLKGDTNQTVTIEQGSTGDRDYTAHWTPTVYSIGYVLNGGSEPSPANPTTYTIESADFTLNNPTRNGGYTFNGWSGSGLMGDPNQTVTIAKGSTGNRTYTANWLGSHKIVLLDAYGSPLRGGYFTITPNILPYATAANQGNDSNELPFLAPSSGSDVDYHLEQTVDPDAKHSKISPFNIRISADGTIQLIDSPQPSGVTIDGNTIRVRNQSRGTANAPELIVRNPDGAGVASVKFDVGEGSLAPLSLTTGDDGSRELPLFQAGATYLLRITDVPAGYNQPAPANFSIQVNSAGDLLSAVGNLPSFVRLDGMDIVLSLDTETVLSVFSEDGLPLSGVTLRVQVGAQEGKSIPPELLGTFDLHAKSGAGKNEVHSARFNRQFDFEFVITPLNVPWYIEPADFHARLKADGTGFEIITPADFVKVEGNTLKFYYRKVINPTPTPGPGGPGGPDGPGEPGGPGDGEEPHLPEDEEGAFYYEDGVKKYAWYHNRLLPATGFAPNRLSALKPLAAPYSMGNGEIQLSIPALSVKTNVLGVPATGQGYDVSWLGANAGWLQDTAFPGRMENGNSVIVGHVADFEGRPGVFSRIEQLRYGDLIFIEAFGERYQYKVNEVEEVYPDTPQVLSQERAYSELTLLTCKYWNEETGVYDGRIIVRALLDSVSRAE